MSPQQIALVQQSWVQTRPDAEALDGLFHFKLLGLDPSMQALLKGEPKGQGCRLMQKIGAVVQDLERADAVVPRLQALGRSHAAYAAEQRDYALVASALLWALKQGLGNAFTDKVQDAWLSAYHLMATAMREAAGTAAA